MRKLNTGSKMWIYGDSFTEGEGTAMFWEGYEEYHEAYSQHFWGYYFISKWLPGYTLVNRGVSGAATQHILNRVLEDINLWRKGDIVILNASSPCRFTFPYKDGNNPNLYMHVGLPEQTYFAWNTLTDNGLGDQLDPDHITFYRKVVVENMDAHEDHNMHLTGLLVNILKSAKDRGIDGAVWDWTMWPYFETQHTWSDGVIDDSHWSPNGNIQFAHVLKDCMDRGVYDLTADWNLLDISRLGSTFLGDIWEKRGTLNEYVEFGNGNNGRSSMRSDSYKALLQSIGKDCVVEYNPNIGYKFFKDII
tara:strand:- start:1909 stop:2823 length:915 start_codon:yes stop_codon:yes gene_type:complete